MLQTSDLRAEGSYYMCPWARYCNQIASSGAWQGFPMQQPPADVIIKRIVDIKAT